MRNATILVASFGLLWGAWAPTASAQRGMGDPAGVAREPNKPEVVSLSGQVVGVETGPCAMSTGRASAGTHFLLKTEKGETLNVHLGPAPAVDFIADPLRAGTKVTVEAFHTEKMPQNHHVAQSLTIDGKTIRLRDEGLRPFWLQGPARSVDREAGAGQPDAALPRWAPPGYTASPARAARPRYGRGAGPGQGRGYGQAPGWGRGAGYGRGPAYGRGAGYGGGAGWAPGHAAGRGLGGGPGRAFQDQDGDGVCDRYQWIRGER